jgi:hypothetical protein
MLPLGRLNRRRPRRESATRDPTDPFVVSGHVHQIPGRHAARRPMNRPEDKANGGQGEDCPTASSVAGLARAVEALERHVNIELPRLGRRTPASWNR